ncbi:major capsid family protein [uncultured Megasphaera sp.]|uniref:major capsid family protein n=1 Tax=uncultured Megasphaera sp. TaxID=165188 RepID=UPI00265B37C1|nr:major capsid family protein [uncultured Megasphaera sp.]
MAKVNYDERDYAALVASNNLDAAGSAFVARQLTMVRAQVLRVKKATLNAFTVFPVTTDIPVGAETALQRTYDSVGVAEIISNWADDLPRVDILAQETSVNVKMLGDAYGYNYREIQNAQFAGINLSAEKGRVAKYGVDYKLNQIAWHGDKAHHITGFLDNPNINEFTLPGDGANNSTKLVDKTEEQVFRDLNNFIESIPEATNQVEQANALLLPPSVYTFLATKRLGDTETTYLNFFRQIHPEITNIAKVLELKGAGPDGKDVMIAGFFDPSYIKFEIPIRFDQRPVEYRNLEYVVNCVASTAGVTVIMPFAFAKAYGC